MMWLYSVALAAGLVVTSPWWITRMLTTERYREGIGERLGSVPDRLRAAVDGFAEQRRVVWVHAVSVGEVLAASRLVGELETALGAASSAEWRVVVSTTTRTGQALARERFGAERVFYFPLDFAWAVRAYIRVLNPVALVLMESELWPRVLHECRLTGIPVAVVNARVSDRSFSRAQRWRAVWGRVLRKVSLWLAQSEDDARRLVAMGARAESVRAIGNLKYDIRAPKESRVAELIAPQVGSRKVIVAGSTVEAEEAIVLDAFRQLLTQIPQAFLILAPRHPERFSAVISLLREKKFWYDCADMIAGMAEANLEGGQVLLLNTIGDLASVYRLAHVTFIGGSLTQRGGHNPLEPAQFGVPVIMGSSYENFRDVVKRMREQDGICIVRNEEELERAFLELLSDGEAARAMGERGRKVFEEQQGATGRAVEAIVAMIHAGAKP